MGAVGKEQATARNTGCHEADNTGEGVHVYLVRTKTTEDHMVFGIAITLGERVSVSFTRSLGSSGTVHGAV